MFKNFLFFIITFYTYSSFAQFRDHLTISQLRSEKDTKSSAIKIGFPPVFTQSFSFFNTLEYRNLDLNSTYHLKALSYALGVKYKTSSGSDIFTGATVALRQNQSLDKAPADSLFYTSYAFYNIKYDYSSFQWGVILLDKSSKYPVMPILGYGYESTDQKHIFKISYPASYYIYAYDDTLQFAVTAAVERQTYRLYNFTTDFLSTEKMTLALSARQQVGAAPVFGSLKIGRNFKEKFFHSSTQTLKDDKQLIKEISENFIELSLSYGKN